MRRRDGARTACGVRDEQRRRRRLRFRSGSGSGFWGRVWGWGGVRVSSRKKDSGYGYGGGAWGSTVEASARRAMVVVSSTWLCTARAAMWSGTRAVPSASE